MAALKDQLRTDLTAAMKARDEVRTRTLRMALTSVTTEEVAGPARVSSATTRSSAVLTREAKRRREAAEAFAAAGRDEQAAAERAEGEVLDAYLPAQLSDEELAAIVGGRIEETGRPACGHGPGDEGGDARGSRAGRTAPGSPPRSAASSAG